MQCERGPGWASGYRACGCAGYAVVRAFREPNRGAVGIADGDAECDAECDADDRAERHPHLVAIGCAEHDADCLALGAAE